jgi:hypothetical protein
MPFINGRYHINPITGQALEAACEAEAALAALQQRALRDSSDSSNGASRDDSCDPDDPTSSDTLAGPGPIHHVEIEASEIVPSSSGRAVRGFVARVHRLPAEERSANDVAGSASTVVIPRSEATRNLSPGSSAPPPETHVFADHRDLVDFLRDALAKDSSQR